MLTKLLKKDLKADFARPLILFALAVVASLISRGMAELGKTIAFFRIANIVIQSIVYTLIGNVIVQSFIMPLVNFGKTMYGDESYLTHTLPVKKSEIILSKTISASIVMTCSLFVSLFCVFILAFSKTNVELIKGFIATVFGGYSTIGIITIAVFLIVFEMVFYYMIIQSAIILCNRKNEKRVVWAIIYIIIEEFIMVFVSLAAISVIFACFGELNSLFSETPAFSPELLLTSLCVSMVLYVIAIVLVYFVNIKLLKKGVNVD